MREIEVTVLGVFIVLAGQSQQGAVFLTHKSRIIPIFIGLPESISIDVARRGETTPRPLSADLCKVILDTCEAKVVSITIDSVDDNTYYARMVIKTEKNETTIDARPSDCIAIALRTGAPIRIVKDIFDQSSMTIDEACERYKIIELDTT